MKRVRLTKHAFDLLLEAVKRSFEKICLSSGINVPRGKAQQYFGFGQKDAETISLHDAFQMHPEVSKRIAEKGKREPTPKYLYNLERQFLELKEPYQSLEVDIDYLDMYCSFLNPVLVKQPKGSVELVPFPRKKKEDFEQYKEFKDFIDKNPGFSDFDREVQRSFLEKENEGQVIPAFSTVYQAYYYYYSKNKICHLEVEIDYINASQEEYPLKITNLHQQIKGSRDPFVYLGKARQLSSCLSATLEEKQHGLPLSLLAYTSHYQGKDMNIIHASLQGISSNGHPTASEIVLVKTKERGQAVQVTGDLDYLKYYLWMQRRYYRVPPRIINNLEYLEARKIDTSEVNDMTGHYRIWTTATKDKKPCILQSYFSIFPDAGAQFQTEGIEKKHHQQIVVMSISHLGENKLCLSTHPKKGVSVINYVIMEIPRKRTDFIGEGVFCALGWNGEMKSDPFVFSRAEEKVGVKFLQEKELQHLSSSHLQNMRDALFRVIGAKEKEMSGFLSLQSQ